MSGTPTRNGRPEATRRRPAEGGTTAADRVADVLLVVGAADEPIGVSSIARRLDLSKAVVYRILRSLTDRGLVRFDAATRAYELGPSSMLIGSRVLQRLDLSTAALPVLRRLQQLTHETTTVSALVGAMRVYLDQVPSHLELKMMVETGRPYPLHAGSSSKAILAFASQELQDHVLGEELPALTRRTVTDGARLRRELDRIRRIGVASSRGERQHGAGSVAAPVFGPRGTVVGSISICGPANRFDAATSRRFASILRHFADEVSTSLGADRVDVEVRGVG